QRSRTHRTGGRGPAVLRKPRQRCEPRTPGLPGARATGQITAGQRGAVHLLRTDPATRRRVPHRPGPGFRARFRDHRRTAGVDAMRGLRVGLIALMLTGVLAVSGCGAVTVQNVPMPEPGIGGPGYTVRARFEDALNLPDRAHVKIGGTDIGVVTDISTTDFVADVNLLIREDIRL